MSNIGRWRRVASLVAMTMITGVIAAGSASAHGIVRPTTSCLGSFEGRIAAGPLADLSLDGRVNLRLSAGGQITGVLLRHDETAGRFVKAAMISGHYGG